MRIGRFFKTQDFRNLAAEAAQGGARARPSAWSAVAMMTVCADTQGHGLRSRHLGSSVRLGIDAAVLRKRSPRCDRGPGRSKWGHNGLRARSSGKDSGDGDN